MRWSILVAALVWSAAVWAGSIRALDAAGGFRDLVWGSAPTTDMVETERDGELVVYTRPGDKMAIGEAVLESLAYFYLSDQLYTVFAVTDGADSSRVLLETLERRYGRSRESRRYVGKHYWYGSQVVLSFDGSSTSGKATAIIVYKPLHKEREHTGGGVTGAE